MIFRVKVNRDEDVAIHSIFATFVNIIKTVEKIL